MSLEKQDVICQLIAVCLLWKSKMSCNYFSLKESTDANTEMGKWLVPYGLQVILQVQVLWIVHINFGLSFSLNEKKSSGLSSIFYSE